MSRAVLAWRDGAATGAQNMAADRAMLDAVEASPDHARVRVYAWSPACVSFGFHQRDEAFDRESLRAVGIDRVRRPTGGAAILHAEEITFAVAAPLGDRASRAVQPLYAPLARAIVRALRQFGVDAVCAGEGRPYAGLCFASHGGHEILVGGRKICGVALRRGRRAYLAHGSLLAGPRHATLANFVRDAAGVDELLSRSTDLQRLGLAPQADRCAEAVLAELRAELAHGTLFPKACAEA